VVAAVAAEIATIAKNRVTSLAIAPKLDKSAVAADTAAVVVVDTAVDAAVVVGAVEVVANATDAKVTVIWLATVPNRE